MYNIKSVKYIQLPVDKETLIRGQPRLFKTLVL
jgi:hypothetical protein